MTMLTQLVNSQRIELSSSRNQPSLCYLAPPIPPHTRRQTEVDIPWVSPLERSRSGKTHSHHRAGSKRIKPQTTTAAIAAFEARTCGSTLIRLRKWDILYICNIATTHHIEAAYSCSRRYHRREAREQQKNAFQQKFPQWTLNFLLSGWLPPELASDYREAPK